jgi:hypothetical protein
MPKNRHDAKQLATVSSQQIDIAASRNDPIRQQKSSATLSCVELVSIAERELAAFIIAVTESLGTEVARLAAEDWLEELSLLAPESLSSRRDVHSVTIAASVRLTRRISSSDLGLPQESYDPVQPT